MHFALLALGSHGDVRPLAALALGLQQRGHAVTLVTSLDHAPFVEALGVGCGRVHIDYRAALQSGLGEIIAQSGANLPLAMWRIDRTIRPLIAQVQHDLWRAAQGADVIVSGLPIFGQDIAEALRVPFVAARLHPDRTGALPSAYWPFGTLPWPWANRLTHDLVDQFAWQPLRRSTNRWRREALGLPPAPFGGPFKAMYQRGDLVLHAYSSATIARPVDWKANQVVTGFWFLQYSNWSPPQSLVDFLMSGSPPIYVGFGSMISDEAEATTDLIVQALRRTGQRAVLASGWGGLGSAVAHDDLCVIDAAPHDWLLPRMAAVVHHGGAGTVAAALRAGVPQVGVPMWGDQRFWARRAAQLGVGPAAIPRTKLSVERLSAAIEQATSDPSMSRRAAALGAIISNEDGVARAVAALEHYLTR